MQRQARMIWICRINKLLKQTQILSENICKLKNKFCKSEQTDDQDADSDTATTSWKVVKVPKPKMGGLHPGYYRDKTWTRGRPNIFWTGQLQYWQFMIDFTKHLCVAFNLESICNTQEWSSTKIMSMLFSHIICSEQQFYNWERSFIFICYVSKQQCTEPKHMLNVYLILPNATIFNDYHNIYVTSTTYCHLHFISTKNNRRKLWWFICWILKSPFHARQTINNQSIIT